MNFTVVVRKALRLYDVPNLVSVCSYFDRVFTVAGAH